MEPIILNRTGDLTLDVQSLVDTRLVVQANSGAGKSWMLRLIAEQAAPQLQTIVLDPEGEFATLRERVDCVLIGRDGELQPNVRAAALLARRLLELNVSAVVDLYDLNVRDRRAFVRHFCESLLALPRSLWHPTLVIIDEAHTFAPEKGHGESEAGDAVVGLMSQGRKRGYCGLLATQRLSKLAKDAAAEANNVLIGRTSLDVDQKRVMDVLGMTGAESKQRLRDLAPGEFFAFGPALSASGVVTFKAGSVRTSHPKAGARHALQAPRPSKAMARVASELADLPAQAEAEIRDLAAATGRIVELEKRLRAAERSRNGAAPVPVRDSAREIAAAAGRDREWRASVKRRDEIIAKLTRQLETARGRLAAIVDQLQTNGDAVDIPTPEPVRVSTGDQSTRPPAAVASSPPAEAAGDIKRGERLVLQAVVEADADGVSRDELMILTGYKSTALYEHIRRLKAAGLIDDRPGAAGYRSTPEGVAALGDFEPLPTGPALADLWRQRLGDGGERRILDALVEAYPEPLSKGDLESRTGYKSTALYEHLRRLKARRIVQSHARGFIASGNLFH